MSVAVPLAVSLPVPLVASVVAVVEEEEGRRRSLLPPEEVLQGAHVDEKPPLGIQRVVAGHSYFTGVVVGSQIIKLVDCPAGIAFELGLRVPG